MGFPIETPSFVTGECSRPVNAESLQHAVDDTPLPKLSEHHPFNRHGYAVLLRSTSPSPTRLTVHVTGIHRPHPQTTPERPTPAHYLDPLPQSLELVDSRRTIHITRHEENVPRLFLLLQVPGHEAARRIIFAHGEERTVATLNDILTSRPRERTFSR